MATRQIRLTMDLEGNFKAEIDKSTESIKRFTRDAAEGAQRAGASIQTMERGALGARAAFQPLNIATQQLTSIVADFSSQAGVAAQSLSALTVNILQSSHAGGGLAGVLAAARSILNPWSLAVIAGGTALAIFFNRAKEAREEQEKFAQAMKSGDIDFFKEKVVSANAALAEMERKFENIIALQQKQLAPPNSPLARAQEAGLDPLRKELATASNAADRARVELANQQRSQALKVLPELEKELALRVKLAAASERARPAIEAESKAQDLLAKGLTTEDIARTKSLLTREAQLKVREIDRKATEQEAERLKKLAEQRRTAEAEAIRSALSEENAIKAQIVALQDGAAAAEALKLQTFELALAQKIGADNAKILTDGIRAESQELARLKQVMDDMKAAAARFDEDEQKRAQGRESELQFLERRQQLLQASGGHEVAKLRITGAPEVEILRKQLELLKAQELVLRNSEVITVEQNRQHSELLKQIELEELRLQQFGQVSVDVGQHIGDSLNNIFDSLISGTLKSVDIGKTVLATLGNIATDIFRQAIAKKLSFEKVLFDNMKGIPAQANNALAAGASAVPQQPGGGGFLQQILGFGGNGGVFGGLSSLLGGGSFASSFGFGTRPEGVSGPLMANGGFFSGPGGGGGFNFSDILSLGGQGGGLLSGLSSLFSGGTLASSFGFGTAPAGVAGPLMANGGFFSGIGTAGGGVLSSLGGIGGALLSNLPVIGGLLGGVLGGTKGPLGAAGGILGSVGGTVLGSSLSLLAGGTGGILASLLPALTPLLSNPITAIIAAIVVAITSIFGAQKVNPTVRVQAQVEGILYDALANQFKAGGVSTKAQGQDIPGSVVKQVKTQVQEILEQQSKVWTDILNIFPKVIHDDMIPALDHANQLLNKMFANLKFSEGGSRSIADEIKALATREAPGKFFIALRGVIGAGLTSAFDRAGLDLGGSVGSSFGELPLSTRTNINKYTYPGLNVPKKAKDMEDFLKAITEFAALSGGLANISSGGVKPFLTEADLATLQTQIDTVLQITDGAKFAKGFEQMQERIKPVVEFLQQSVQQATDIFGRGLIAALDAATESEANAAFLANLGEGVKDIIFQGITSAFVASAQFNDLLAPIQKTIREFTEQAVATGETPDLAAFRAAIMPGIEDITTRAETLAPLIAELQKLGLDVKDALGLVAEVTATAKGAEININIAEFTGTEADVRELAGRLDEFLTPLLNP